jgi:hypothetical protein
MSLRGSGQEGELCSEAQAGLDFNSFVTTVWNGYGVSAIELMKGHGSETGGAVTSIRRRVQRGFMKQIAINGLKYVRKFRAHMGAGQL